MKFFGKLISLFMISSLAYGVDNVIVNPVPNSDTVIKVNKGGVSVEVLRAKGTNGSLSLPQGTVTTDSLPTNMTVGSGETYFKPKTTIPGGVTLTVNGTFYTVGKILGTGTIAGTGTILAVDAGQNGDALSVSRLNVSSNFISTTGSNLGSISNSGAWSIGPSVGGVTHSLFGNTQIGPNSGASTNLNMVAGSTSLNNAINFNDSTTNRFYLNHINNATLANQYIALGSGANGDALKIDAVGTGIKLPTAGGTAADLNSYEEFTHSTTWTLSGTANVSSSTSIHITKIGKVVTMCGPPVQVTGAAGASSSIDMNTPIPSRFRPNFIFLLPGSRTILGGTTQAAPGNITTGTNGVISIFRDFSNPALNWATSGVNGFQNDWCTVYNQQ